MINSAHWALSMKGDLKGLKRTALALAMGVSVLCLPAVTGGMWQDRALAQDKKEKPTKPQAKRSETLSQGAYDIIVKAQEAYDLDQFAQAKTLVNQIISGGDKFKPFDQATAYRYRGFIASAQDNYQAAASDFESALGFNKLSDQDQLDLRYYLAQLYLANEQPAKAIQNLELWFAKAENPQKDAYYFAAQVYASVERFNDAVTYAVTAVQKMEAAGEKRENWYGLNVAIYARLNRYRDARPLLEKMVTYWPAKAQYYDQLGGVYQELGQDKAAFAVLALKYDNGLAKKENEIVRLSQLYRLHGFPYKSARIMETELKSGKVKDTWKNNRELGDAWIQAREHSKAITPLTKAARGSGDGEIWLRLCQTYVQDEKWDKAAQACSSAVGKGLKGNARPQGQMLAGYSAYEMFKIEREDKPESKRRDKAMEFFEACATTEKMGEDCTRWITHINQEKEMEAFNADQLARQAAAQKAREQQRDEDVGAMEEMAGQMGDNDATNVNAETENEAGADSTEN